MLFYFIKNTYIMDFDPKKNYYESLWVSEEATKQEIKKAFRKLAMKYHPDRQSGDEDKFKEINEAHEVLSDDKKRQMYDTYRKWGWGFDFGWMWWWGWFQWWSFDVSDLFWDMFWDLFGGSWGRRRASDQPQRGDDMILNLKVKFEDVYSWAEKKIKYNRYVLCNICDGKGESKDSNPKTCPTCHGGGVVTQTQRTPFGMMQSQTVCPTCRWKWKTWYKACENCNGKWVTIKEEIIEIKIPQWVDSWTKLRMPWMWHYGYKWWTPWDLYISIIIDEKSQWKKSWKNIIIEKDIDIIDAVLWWTMDVELPDKSVKVKVPKWLQVWEDIYVSWYGFRKWEGLLHGKWDLIIKPKIKIPKVLSKKEKELYNKLKEESSK